MKRISIFLLAMICAGSALQAQSGQAARPKIAVYATGNVSEGHKLYMANAVEHALIQGGNVEVLPRQSAILEQLAKERGYQKGGSVSDRDIARLGVELGATIICVVEVNDFLGLEINARSISVEQNRAVRSARTDIVDDLNNKDQLRKAAQEIVNQLTGSGGSRTSGGGSSSGGTNRVNETVQSSKGQGRFQDFFPVYGVTLGKTNSDDMRRLGYTPKLDASNRYHCKVQTMCFFDNDNDDDIYDWISVVFSGKGMPEMWTEKSGFKYSLSYNEWMTLLKQQGFSIKVIEAPVTKTFNGRNTLSAEFEAISTDGLLIFDFYFRYGNEDGEGYDIYAKNSLYDIYVKIVKN
jgi:hypothetical protein